MHRSGLLQQEIQLLYLLSFAFGKSEFTQRKKPRKFPMFHPEIPGQLQKSWSSTSGFLSKNGKQKSRSCERDLGVWDLEGEVIR